MSKQPHRRPTRTGVAAALAGGVLVLAVAGCTSSSAGHPAAAPNGASTTVVAPAIKVADPVPFDVPARFTVTHGTLQSVTVKGHLHGTPLPGQVLNNGTTWVSDGLPLMSASYDITARVKDSQGDVRILTARLVVATLAPASILGYDVTPFQGWTVGVNAPIVIRFHKPVQDRANVERALTVSTPAPVVGAWHWVNSQEIHFRPLAPWPAHSAIRLDANLDAVRAGPALWGVTDTSVVFTTGDTHLTKVDARAHTLTLIVNGRTVGVWPTSLGRPQFATRSGSYVVLEKAPSRQMTSCSAQITCSPSNPNYYNLTVNWDVRLTYSGTFIHSAPWSVAEQGVDNVSHGCINLSPAHAQTYYALARYGDLVTVTGTSRTAADLVASGDPGMADWNEPWATYAAASALGGQITTQPMPAG